MPRFACTTPLLDHQPTQVLTSEAPQPAQKPFVALASATCPTAAPSRQLPDVTLPSGGLFHNVVTDSGREAISAPTGIQLCTENFKSPPAKFMKDQTGAHVTTAQPAAGKLHILHAASLQSLDALCDSLPLPSPLDALPMAPFGHLCIRHEDRSLPPCKAGVAPLCDITAQQPTASSMAPSSGGFRPARPGPQQHYGHGSVFPSVSKPVFQA